MKQIPRSRLFRLETGPQEQAQPPTVIVSDNPRHDALINDVYQPPERIPSNCLLGMSWEQRAIAEYIGFVANHRRNVDIWRANAKTATARIDSTTWEAWEETLTKARLSDEARTRRGLLDFYNTNLAPHLTTEEAALQMLAQELAYLYLLGSESQQDGFKINLHITDNLANQQVSWYAEQNFIREVIVGKKGCVAHLLWPKDDEPEKAAVIFFTGTNADAQRDVLCARLRPIGMTADLEANLASEAFEECKDRLLAWVGYAHLKNEERPITIVGHSLGGALAMRLMGSIDERFHPWISLITYSSPGIDENTINNIPTTRTRMIWHELDPVTLFPGRHPSGTGYEVANQIDTSTSKNLIQNTHIKKHLVEWQLLGASLCFRRLHDANHPLNPIGKVFREWIGFVYNWTIKGLVTP